MSSRLLNVKGQTKRDRPRSSEPDSDEEHPRSAQDKLRKGKRDGTPDKPGTPSLPEEGSPVPEKKPVIINDEILSLAIKHDDLNKLKEPRPPTGERKSPPLTSVLVRKLKPASEWDKPKPKTVTVARPAPPDAQLKTMDYTGAAGPRFDEYGRIVPHSILGDVDDYVQLGVSSGELPAEVAHVQYSHSVPTQMGTKYARKTPTQHPKMESVEESNALRNWQVRMAERRKQQGYLSKFLGKSADELVMNQADSYRQTQEARYILDRTIPTMDYGKGYRVGSEFWKQQERFGDDITGIHMSLGQTEKGYPPPIEHIGVPKTVLEEKGTDWARPRSGHGKPWHKTAYLHQRKDQLQSVIKELDPYYPDMLDLEVVGKARPKSGTLKTDRLDVEAELMMQDTVAEEDLMDLMELDPLSDHPDVHPEPVFGPSILFAGQPARWTGDSVQFKGQVGINARVTFEAYAGKRSTSFLEIVNDGTTCIYYNWQKMPKSNPFDIVHAKIQRFYFNNNNGVILPGDTMKFPFVFKSPNAGVFTEDWAFQTHPVVYGGATLLVTLRGVALQEDKLKAARSQLEVELAHRQAVQIVTRVLDDILDGIRTPERPRSPVDTYITEQQIFERRNANLQYHNETITDLHNMYKALLPEEEQENVTWDFDINSLKELILTMDEEDERKQEFLNQLNMAVITLSFPPFSPKQKLMYHAGYQILASMVDKMVERSAMIRNVLGLPDTRVEVADDPKKGVAVEGSTTIPTTAQSQTVGDSHKSGKSRKSSSKLASTPKGKRGRSTPAVEASIPAASDPASPAPAAAELLLPDPKHQGKSDKTKPPGVKSDKADGKEKKGGKREEKQPPKTPAKDTGKGGKITPAASMKGPSSEEIIRTPPADTQRPHTAFSTDPVLNHKYNEKIYTQTYSLVSEAIDQMSEAFAEVQLSEGGPVLPSISSLASSASYRPARSV